MSDNYSNSHDESVSSENSDQAPAVKLVKYELALYAARRAAVALRRAYGREHATYGKGGYPDHAKAWEAVLRASRQLRGELADMIATIEDKNVILCTCVNCGGAGEPSCPQCGGDSIILADEVEDPAVQAASTKLDEWVKRLREKAGVKP